MTNLNRTVGFFHFFSNFQRQQQSLMCSYSSDWVHGYWSIIIQHKGNNENENLNLKLDHIIEMYVSCGAEYLLYQ